LAASIIVRLQDRIRRARVAGRRLEQVTTEPLAERYRAERETDPDLAETTKITDVVDLVPLTPATNGPTMPSRCGKPSAASRSPPTLAGSGTAAKAADRITDHAENDMTFQATDRAIARVDRFRWSKGGTGAR
jgi:hypothetical protein